MPWGTGTPTPLSLTVWAGEVADHVHMAAGRCYYLDMREDHASDNAGDTARVHLVLDVIADASVRAVIGERE